MTRLAQEQGDGCQVCVRVDQNPPDYLVLDSLGLRGERELAIGGLGGLAAHERPSKELERPPLQESERPGRNYPSLLFQPPGDLVWPTGEYPTKQMQPSKPKQEQVETATSGKKTSSNLAAN